MLYLYVFGDNVEDAFGHGSYLVFYLVSGLAASFTYVLTASPQDLTEGVVGASGAISGVLGAYAVLYPRSRILTLILAGFPIILPIPAVLFLGFWFVLQWLYVVFGIASGVAYFAHIGGFVFGVLLAVTVGRRRKRAREARKRL
jgi:membrane associated rhomboid family serine protease